MLYLTEPYSRVLVNVNINDGVGYANVSVSMSARGCLSIGQERTYYERMNNH